MTKIKQKPRPMDHGSHRTLPQSIIQVPLFLLVISACRSEAFSSVSTLGKAGIRRSSTMSYADSLPNQNQHVVWLQYRDRNDEDAVVGRPDRSRAVSSRIWWPFASASKDTSDENSQKVDEYLEFLDRRYLMLHEDDEDVKKSLASSKFSALRWLRQGVEEVAVTDVQQEDALYVLGVAGVASQRLLQRHSPNPSSRVCEEDSVDVQSVQMNEIETTSRPVAVLSIIMARLTPAIRRVLQQKQLLLRFQSSQLETAVVRMSQGLVKGSWNALKAVWKHGGGTRSLALAGATLAVLFLYLVKPLATAFLKEGFHMTRAA